MNNSNSNKWSALLIFIATCSTLLVGCATGNVMKWTGQSEFVGQGGAVQTIKGVDFYMRGEPAGRFRVLSIIQGSYYRGGNLLMSAFSEQKAMHGVVKEAKAEGADAVIVLSSEYQVLGSSTVGSGIGSVQGTATSFGPTTTFNGTASVNYTSSTVIHGAQSGSVALVKYIDVRR
jgi:hypothetical protein